MGKMLLGLHGNVHLQYHEWPLGEIKSKVERCHCIQFWLCVHDISEHNTQKTHSHSVSVSSLSTKIWTYVSDIIQFMNLLFWYIITFYVKHYGGFVAFREPQLFPGYVTLTCGNSCSGPTFLQCFLDWTYEDAAPQQNFLYTLKLN